MNKFYFKYSKPSLFKPFWIIGSFITYFQTKPVLKFSIIISIGP